MTTRIDEAVSMREHPAPFGTADLPDEVVNQRVMATVYMSQDNDRHARWGVGVWVDRGGPDDKPFTIGPEGWRGMDGEGLTRDEARYVASCLYSGALRLARAADVG
jgi:hypothetical protein